MPGADWFLIVAGYAKLTFLIKRTQSDGDLEVCQAHSDLQVLNLSGSMVLGYGFEYLLDNRSLSEIYLSGTPIKSQYLHILSGLPDLQLVDISNTGIDNIGLAALARVGAEGLIVDKVKDVSDAGLTDFAAAPLQKHFEKLSMNAIYLVTQERLLLVGSMP